ncbi:hypothetical protein [uncultured Aquimarina sp.]|uniref:hypothetical protein n=1 Tax=uncultured Aquimarina sp. TaxID=575652 RepID=UPI002629CC5B|nr:hypothetical protein [uncultured Aquimarina sp.]
MITLEIVPSNKGLEFFYEKNEATYWNVAIELGVRLAFEQHISGKTHSNYSIFVKEFKWMDVDTNLITVCYASCRATYSAFDVEKEFKFPKINNEGEFIFKQ